MRKTCLDLVYQLAQADERVIFVGSDLGVGTLDELKAEFPERFLMEGVSEAHVVGMAAGLAMSGYVPYVNTIASFITRRCLEQLILDVCLEQLPVRLIGNGAGLVYAPLGPTHQATDDLAHLRAMPEMTILAPADAEEMRQLMPQTLDHAGPIYIRLAKGYDPIVTSEATERAVLGRGRWLNASSGEALAITTGVTAGMALDAAKILSDKGIKLSVLHLPTVKPLDEEMILAAARGAQAVVTIEEHSVIGGLGSAVAELLLEAGVTPRFRRLGLPDAFADGYGSQRALLAKLGLSAASVADAVQKLFAHRRMKVV
ncbi:MAG: transketolase [Deltaproteobacteria bacterium]|nr:transketolase [Deltaproteobacteria bacterium]